MFALVDCNNFYVSCEKVFDPTLENRPVIVLSNNDGCVISRSDEAKKIGFKMGEPVFKKYDWLKQYNVKVFSSNYTLYGDMSDRVMTTLTGFSPKTEQYSIDECFLDLSFVDVKDILDYGYLIKNITVKNTGIPVGVGIGTTKTLAKIANKIAKRNLELNGVFYLDTKRRIKTALKNTPVDEIWGIGRQYAKLLVKNNINNAYEFSLINDHWIKKNLSVMGLRIKKELSGESCLPLETIIKQKKAIATTRAFGKKTDNYNYLREAVATYAIRCSEKLRKQKCLANLITVFIHTDPFNPNEKYINYTKTVAIPIPTNNNAEIVKYALFILKNIFRKGLKYKKAGVIVDDLVPDSSVQFSLFDKADIQKSKKVSNITDFINAKYGRDTLKLSVQGDGNEWKLRQENLSKKYTTRFQDIIKINAK